MAASRAIEKEIQAQRRIISRLKREIFGVDKTHKSLYIREFQSEFRGYRSICGAAEVIEKAAECDIIYFGDYHPLDASQDWVLRFMRELASRGRRVVLALEMLYVHQQESLDRWMKGAMGEREFLETIEYRSEWGFNWESYRRIFELAKDPFMPVFGIDSETRDHLGHIRRRDRLAARRISTIRSFFPDHCILVVIGESHLAASHLPCEVRRAIHAPYREIVIVQNIDEIYFRLMRRGREKAEAVRIGRGRYCLVTASPIVKYRAYREIIDVWVDGDEADKNTPFLHETIQDILTFLFRGRKKTTVTIGDGRRESLEAVLPEVQCRSTHHSFAAYLRAKKVSPRGAAYARGRLKTKGIAYVPEINTFLVLASDRQRGVEEAARFVLHLLRNEIGQRPRRQAETADDFYRDVIDEALVCLGASVIDPAQECAAKNTLLAALDSEDSSPRSPEGYSAREIKELIRVVRSCIEHERNGATSAPTARFLRRFRAFGIRKRMLVTQALGARLGTAFHRAFHEGLITEREILALIRTRFDAPGVAPRAYCSLVERIGAPRSGAPRGSK